MDDQARYVDLPNGDRISVSVERRDEGGQARTVAKFLRGEERGVGLVVELEGLHDDRTALARLILLDLLQQFGDFAGEHLLAPFRPDEAAHRGRLFAALRFYALPVREEYAPPNFYLSVPLFDQPSGTGAGLLEIMSDETVYLNGWGGTNGGPVTSRDWQGNGAYPAATLVSAVVAFLIFWGQRREWIKRYQRGELDDVG